MVEKNDWKKDAEEDRDFIISESELSALLRSEWLETMIGLQVSYQICKELGFDSKVPYRYAEERLKNFVQYNPKLP